MCNVRISRDRTNDEEDRVLYLFNNSPTSQRSEQASHFTSERDKEDDNLGDLQVSDHSRHDHGSALDEHDQLQYQNDLERDEYDLQAGYNALEANEHDQDPDPPTLDLDPQDQLLAEDDPDLWATDNDPFKDDQIPSKDVQMSRESPAKNVCRPATPVNRRLAQLVKTPKCTPLPNYEVSWCCCLPVTIIAIGHGLLKCR